jgi:MSHA biogenesis protein MshP
MKRKLQHGFSLISAIFLLVVIAALGAFAVTLSTTQHQSQAMEVMGARAYQAALAGVEWAAFNVANSPVNALAPAVCTVNPMVVLGGNLAPFTVVVNCLATSAVEGTSTIWIYDVSAVANTGGNPGDVGYVEQVATAKLAR